ncbi:hypothetical protein LTS09_010252 [Friedmanniomyces endolithicus]|nr:hypothetical protein LTS09_010252 [Friedmanniomyces endolithicus]
MLAFGLIAQITAQSSTMSNSSMSTMSTSTKSSASSSSTESGSAATGTQGFPPQTGGNSGSGDAGGGTSGGTANTSSATPSSTKSGAGMVAVVGVYTESNRSGGAMRGLLTLLSADYTFVGSAAVGAIVVGLTVVLQGAQSTPTEDITFEEHQRRREWNRPPLRDLFPRVPAAALERVLDLCIARPFTYNLSQSKIWNARHLTSVVVAHVRHAYSDYDKLLREQQVERFEARHRTAERVWKVLKEWCPWDESNEVLERCFRVTLLRPEERQPADAEWDPMDIDDYEEPECVNESDFVGDPMEID